ncbi:MAG: T9SS type A sorting domain-containing protein [Flavobacteriales bacterium]|nr:T9SS type A sorting domain-containing protein [Flavobacteriales bacterium]
MKLTLTIAFLFSSLIYSAQGTITSIETYPSSPTTTDSVYLIAHLSFTAGDCDKQSFSASVIGNNVVASAHHCIGMLTVICDISDTTNLGLLPAGTYNVDLTLSSGAAPIPCSPGFAPDDNDTMSFTVIAPTSISELTAKSNNFRLAPNPTNNIVYLSGNDLFNHIGEQLSIFSFDGKLVHQSALSNDFSIDISSLPVGIYMVRISSFIPQKLIKIQ